MGVGGGEQGEVKIGVGRRRGPVKAGKSKMYLVRPERPRHCRKTAFYSAGVTLLVYPSLLPVLVPATSSTNSDSLTF
jgi:hypothetical protein